ncbi:MAG: hypothetical protein OK452_06345 [Thaumarchaeota archaeon]|nr:hypothetical protein [Nitrososphaerota archaeon]
MQTDEKTATSDLNYRRGRGIVKYDGFYVLREIITKCRIQLEAIAALTPIQKQFIGTLVDTEVAVGYFLVANQESNRRWTAYLAVKMKYGGDVAYLSRLIGGGPPSRSFNANTITHSKDLRWSKQVQGLVAYALLKEVRSYLHNEKSIVEVQCIMKYGPRVSADRPHPFVEFGATRLRRGVWYWPQIDNGTPLDELSTAPK